MKKQRKDKHFVKNAFYKGGNKAMEKFISEHLTYPKTALENKIHGTIHIKYDVNHRGKVFKVKSLNTLGYGCDEEAERVVKLLQFEVPKARGLRLIFHKEIHIHFNINNKNEIQNENQSESENSEKQEFILEYSIVKKEKKQIDTKKEEDNSSDYSYTVDY
jgi:protein TonB